MHFKAFIISSLAAIAAAESLTDAINEFPSCSIRCFSDKVKDEDCELTDFKCICNNQVGLAVKLGSCAGDVCNSSGSSFDAGKALGDLCERWYDNPSSSEVAAATSTLGAAISAAPTSTTTSTPTNAAVGTDAGIKLAGALAAAAMLI